MAESVVMHLLVPFVIVDLESTGTSTRNDRITEVALIEVDPAGSVAEWASLVNPGVPISGFIQSLTGISNEMVADAPAFADLADELYKRLAGKLFIAHNARFDFGMLRSEFERAGYTFEVDTLCTVNLSRALFPAQENHKLDTLIEVHAIHMEDRHRALADAQAVWHFLNRVKDSLSADLIERIIKRAPVKVAPPPLPESDEEAEIALVAAILGR